MSAVLFVGNFLSKAGFNRAYVEELTDRLERRSWKVLRTSERPGRASRLADMARFTLRHHRDYDRAHIDVFSGLAFLWAEVVAYELRALGKPFALTLHGGNLPTFGRQWPRRTRALLAAAHTVTTPSDYLHEQMRSFRSDLVVVPNAIDVATNAFRPRSSAAPKLVWIRALTEIYNPLMAVDVLAHVARTHPDVHLTMVGPDKADWTPRLAARAAELGVGDKLELVGGVPRAEIPRYLDAADVFINTTNVDNTPLSVLEAMSAGLCIVSTDVGGLPYIIRHEREGLLSPPGDAPAMAARVVRVLEEPTLASQLSRAGRERAMRHSWDDVIDQWDHLLRSLRSDKP